MPELGGVHARRVRACVVIELAATSRARTTASDLSSQRWRRRACHASNDASHDEPDLAPRR
ncbi:MAG: hypothetical protein KC503_02745 [Myxococcales bacterium]|nr:hypothetical protein [Myxococcales bacterium]